MSNSTSCAGLQPYAKSGGPTNSCAWTLGNFSVATQSAINKCCGGPPYAYNPIGDPLGCFQACNIINGSTAEELQQNENTLLSCLGPLMLNIYCVTTPPKSSSGHLVGRGPASWSVIVTVGVLVGTSLFIL